VGAQTIRGGRACQCATGHIAGLNHIDDGAVWQKELKLTSETLRYFPVWNSRRHSSARQYYRRQHTIGSGSFSLILSNSRHRPIVGLVVKCF